MAIRNDAEGEILMPEDESGSEYIEWFKLRNGSYMQTMMLYEGLLYNLRWNGSLQCYDARSGAPVYDRKLGRAESFTASPVASDGKIYLVNDKGKVYIVESGPEFRIIKENELEDISMVTPAITDKILFFRTQQSLIAISDE